LQHFLGHFKSEEEGARAYDRALLQRKKKDGCLNFPLSDYQDPPSSNATTSSTPPPRPPPPLYKALSQFEPDANAQNILLGTLYSMSDHSPCRVSWNCRSSPASKLSRLFTCSISSPSLLGVGGGGRKRPHDAADTDFATASAGLQAPHQVNLILSRKWRDRATLKRLPHVPPLSKPNKQAPLPASQCCINSTPPAPTLQDHSRHPQTSPPPPPTHPPCLTMIAP